MPPSNFERLEIYSVASELSDEIWDEVCGWTFFSRSTVGRQLVRSADSIGANIAEGAGRGSPREHAHFLKIARGSLYEMKFWLERAEKRKLVSPETARSWIDTIQNLAPRLNAYLNHVLRH